MPRERLSFIGGAAGTTQDPGNVLVEELLSRLDFGQPQPPQGPGTAGRIFGSLGDALLAAAAVRAGGAPPAVGPFAAGQRRKQEVFEAAKAAAEAEKREFRNRIFIKAIEQELGIGEAAAGIAPVDVPGTLEGQFGVLSFPREKGGTAKAPTFVSGPSGFRQARPFQFAEIGENVQLRDPVFGMVGTIPGVTLPPPQSLAETITANRNVIRLVSGLRQTLSELMLQQGVLAQDEQGNVSVNVQKFPQLAGLANVSQVISAIPVLRNIVGFAQPQIDQLRTQLIALAQATEQAGLRGRVGEARFSRIQQIVGELGANPFRILDLADEVEEQANFLIETLASTSGFPSAAAPERRKSLEKRRDELLRKRK